MRQRRTGKNDRLDVVVLAQLPDEELGEVSRVDELSQWLACSADDEGGIVLCKTRQRGISTSELRRTLSEQALVHKGGDDMGTLEIAVK